MIKHIPIGLRWLLVLLIALSSALEANTAAGNDDALIGQKYEIVGELYAHRVADDLNSRVVSFISLVPLQLTGPEIISRQLVPTGSILTIVEKAPKRLFAFLYPDRYIVRVNTIRCASRDSDCYWPFTRNRGSIDGAKSAHFQATI
jgi:hypothetical protein